MSKNARLSLIIIAVVVVVIGGIFLFNRTSSTSAQPSGAGGKVAVVEYLDLECPSCRAAFPAVEKLKGEYGDKVTFTIRHFPIPSHRNAEPAATAVEAAANQGKRDEMFKLMFESQQQWGGKQTPQLTAFQTFAQQLGLDMAKFDADVKDPATRGRVLADRDEGTKAGVTGTPTFFVDGTQFRQQATYDALKKAIDKALDK